jgi:hypothetical protein
MCYVSFECWTRRPHHRRALRLMFVRALSRFSSDPDFGLNRIKGGHAPSPHNPRAVCLQACPSCHDPLPMRHPDPEPTPQLHVPSCHSGVYWNSFYSPGTARILDESVT